MPSLVSVEYSAAMGAGLFSGNLIEQVQRFSKEPFNLSPFSL